MIFKMSEILYFKSFSQINKLEVIIPAWQKLKMARADTNHSTKLFLTLTVNQCLKVIFGNSTLDPLCTTTLLIVVSR